MADSGFPARPRLAGISIFLSASVPSQARAEQFRRVPEAAMKIEGAVVSLARAVFIEGGTLVFGAHPSISPLVSRVADHYYLPPAAEEMGREGEREPWKNPSVHMYQSRVWSDDWAEDNKRLAQHPLTSLEWVEAAEGETVDAETVDRPQAPLSMEKMRREMLRKSSPVAMVAIGGMDGVMEEARIFSDMFPSRPIFALETTGGAAALLPDDPQLSAHVRSVDTEARNLVEKFWIQEENATARRQMLGGWDREGGNESRSDFYVPYNLVAQQIVQEIGRITQRFASDERDSGGRV